MYRAVTWQTLGIHRHKFLKSGILHAKMHRSFLRLPLWYQTACSACIRQTKLVCQVTAPYWGNPHRSRRPPCLHAAVPFRCPRPRPWPCPAPRTPWTPQWTPRTRRPCCSGAQGLCTGTAELRSGGRSAGVRSQAVQWVHHPRDQHAVQHHPPNRRIHPGRYWAMNRKGRVDALAYDTTGVRAGSGLGSWTPRVLGGDVRCAERPWSHSPRGTLRGQFFRPWTVWPLACAGSSSVD